MESTRIKNVIARQIIDCKCRPIVEVDVITEGGAIGRASAPTGSSVGTHEAYVLRDNNPSEYGGLSVHKAVDNVNSIIGPALIGMDVMDQRTIDELMIAMDGTPNKSKLGGNAIYSVSAACIRAAAHAMNMPLYRYLASHELETIPVPSFNFINGGRYGDITLAFNEFIMVPYKAKTIDEAVEMGVNVFQKLGKVIAASGLGEPIVGRSFGWAAPSDDPEVIMDLMQEAVCACGYQDKVGFALDCAMSQMYDAVTGTYLLKGKQVDSNEIIALVKRMSERYNFVYIEDILGEDDWDGFVNAVRELTRTIIIGDDFIVTNLERLKKAYELKAVDGFIFKPNQVGTITEAIDTHRFALEHGMITIPSGRAGGVVGDIIMDLAVGLQVGIIKNGAPRSGERIDKLNFLLRVASENPSARLYDFSKHVRF
ncbi:phosphopyruvate hydratase [Thermoanaerobacteraceae bacterium SP2]|nr:phosphopyruvate hydratase [Thermoanaerobacteraceae bacterium SP2]